MKGNNNEVVGIVGVGNVEGRGEEMGVWVGKEEEEGFEGCGEIVLW